MKFIGGEIMKTKLLTIIGIGLLGAFFVYPAFSHSPRGNFSGNHMGPGYYMGPGNHMGPGYHMGPGNHMGGQGHHGPWYGDNDLTEDQRAKIGKLSQNFAADTNDIRQQLRQKATELNALLAAPESDKAQALKIQKELNSLRNTMAEKRLELDLQVKKIVPEGLSQNTFCAGPGSGRGHMLW